MNLDDDFFGYNLNLSDTPVDFSDIFSDVFSDEIPTRGHTREDLSGGSYIPIDSTDEFSDSGKNFNQPRVGIKTVRHQFRMSKLNKLFWKLGASLAVTGSLLFFCNLAIAERSGGLDRVRVYHLGSANKALLVMSLLVPIGVFAGIGKVEKLIGVPTDEKSNQ